MKGRRGCFVLVVALLTTLSGPAAAHDAAPAYGQFDDPRGDEAPARIPAADLVRTDVFLQAQAPDLIVVPVLVGRSSLASSPSAPGITFAIAGSGHDITGRSVTFTMTVTSAGVTVQTPSGPGHCPRSDVVAESSTSIANAFDVDVPNVPSCLGARLFDVSVAVSATVRRSGLSASDRLPNTGSTGPTPLEPDLGDAVGLARDGVEYRGLDTGGDEATLSAPYAYFGNPGDVILTADGPDRVGASGQREIANGLVAVRAQRGGGLHWYKRYDPTCDSPDACQGGGPEAVDFAFGNTGDIPLAGDWDGDGLSTVGVFRPSTGQWIVSDDPAFVNAPGASLRVIAFGSPGDQPVAGDWDGDGYDTPAVFRAGRWYELNTFRSGTADRVVGFGSPGDVAEPGGWYAGTFTGLGVFRHGQWYITNDPEGGLAQNSFPFGDDSYQPFVFRAPV